MNRRSVVVTCVLIGLGVAPARAQPAAQQPAAQQPAAPQPPASQPVPPPPAAPASAAPAPAAAAPTPLATLMDQARYWRQQGRGDLALAALRRALLLDPHNADALAQSAAMNAERGDRAAAEADLAGLRAAQPADPRLDSVERTLRTGPIDPGALAQARDLARQGHGAQAIERYRALFRGGPPPDALAVEYNQVLASTEGGWDDARSGLARTVAHDPQDTRAQLAYAELLTYRPATRVDGIDRLAILANNPATADSARKAWRQALEWLPVDPGSVALYQPYLAAHPDDAGMAQRLTDAQTSHRTQADQAGLDRQQGFDALQANRLGDAETAFQAALAVSDHDSDALGGLGLVRQRQHKDAEARDLLERAIAAAPDKAAQWQSALSGATVASALVSAQAQARSGDLSGAETSFRAVLAQQPDNTGALIGLAGVLTRRGHDAEAQTLLARAGPAARGPSVAQAKLQQLRSEAESTTDPQAAIALLRRASDAAPTDPWIKLDLARLLVKQGQAVEAQELMATLSGETHPSVDALHAAAIFAMETNHPGEAAALAGRIPASSRGNDINRLLANIRFEQSLRRVVADAAISGDGRQKLLDLAAAPDPTGVRGAAIVRALVSLNDSAGARQAIAVALAANPNPTSEARIAYAGALLAAGQDADAGRLLASVEMQGGVTADQHAAVASLRNGIAVRSSDRLNQQGETAEAYDRLAPVLAQSPTDSDLNLALARLYQTSRDPKQALTIAEALLRRDPANLDARRAAVSAAIEMGDLATADMLVRDGHAANPDDPRVWLMSADLARARGNDGQVLSDLRTAQTLRRQQIGTDPPFATAFAATAGGTNPFRLEGAPSPPGGPTGAPPNGDPMTADIAHAIAAAQAELAPNIAAAPAFRQRSGSSGLDELTEVSSSQTASFSPGGYGRLTVTATPTWLSNGQLQASTAAQQQFGTLVFGGSPPGSQHAQGIGLSAAYRYRWMAVDAGSTPLGFRVENAVGGLELSPELADGVRLRAAVERRAVTDSLLSYAGTVDPGSGQTFGGVVRNRGHAQLEFTPGLANFYAGGGYSQLTGQNVATNNATELGAGGSYPIYRNATDELRAGLDLVYFTYAKNLDHFTLGQGGYFSPQSYFAALVPLTFTRRLDNLTWSLGGSIGAQSYTENSTPVFPNNANLQSQLNALAAGNSTILAAYPGTTQTGIVGGVHGSLEYQVTPSLRVGGLIRYDHAGNWSETQATVFARYIFNNPE